jgi:hypothetical protein
MAKSTTESSSRNHRRATKSLTVGEYWGKATLSRSKALAGKWTPVDADLLLLGQYPKVVLHWSKSNQSSVNWCKHTQKETERLEI